MRHKHLQWIMFFFEPGGYSVKFWVACIGGTLKPLPFSKTKRCNNHVIFLTGFFSNKSKMTGNFFGVSVDEKHFMRFHAFSLTSFLWYECQVCLNDNKDRRENSEAYIVCLFFCSR